MKKLIKNGFTLIELMTSMGIVSVIALVIINSQNSVIKSTGQVQRSTDVNNMLQMINTQLGSSDVCMANFKTKPFVDAAVTVIPSINNKQGTPFITSTAPFNYFGEEKIKITDIRYTAKKTGSKYALNLQVTYVWKEDRVNPAPVTSVFNLNINVGLNTSVTPNVINSCNNDSDLLLTNAVENGCKGNRARYFPPDATYRFGHCEHLIELYSTTTNGAVATGPISYACPVGEFLKRVDNNADAFLGAGQPNKTIFVCEKAKTKSGTKCTGWNYMEGVNDQGVPVCKDIRNLIGTTGLMTGSSGGVKTYTTADLKCAAGKVMVRIDAGTGKATCVDPYVTYTCPSDQYFQGFDAAGAQICTAYPSSPSVCTAPNFMTAVDSVGEVTCGAATISANCGADYVMTGIDAAGAASGCVYNGL